MEDKTTLRVDEQADGIKIVHVLGDLDSMGTHTVSKSFEGALSERKARAVIDLSDVGFISSAGMAMLLVRGKSMRQGGGRMAIAAASGRVMEVLSLAGFHELFDVYPTVDEALSSMQDQGE